MSQVDMRVIRVRTASGSLYELNPEKLTWKRAETGVDYDPANPLRTEEGKLIEWPEIKVGVGMALLCPPITAGTTFRLVYTSDVVEVLAEGRA